MERVVGSYGKREGCERCVEAVSMPAERARAHYVVLLNEEGAVVK